jgi:DNA-binding transcriptional MerR regulator
MSNRIFTLDELCALTDLPKRTVRYYIQIGLVSRPIGETRGAHYDGAHLEQLLQIRRLTATGISLDRIREIMAGEDLPVPLRSRRPGSIDVRTHLFVAPGIEIQISPEEAGLTPEEIRAFVRDVIEVAGRTLKTAKQ